MALKANAEQVEDFTLVEVGGGPERADGLDRGISLVKQHSQADTLLIGVRQEVVAQLEPRRCRVPVYRGHVIEEVVAGGLQGGCGSANILGSYGQSQLVEVESCVGQRFGLPGKDGLECRVFRESAKDRTFIHQYWFESLAHVRDPPCPGSS